MRDTRRLCREGLGLCGLWFCVEVEPWRAVRIVLWAQASGIRHML